MVILSPAVQLVKKKKEMARDMLIPVTRWPVTKRKGFPYPRDMAYTKPQIPAFSAVLVGHPA